MMGQLHAVVSDDLKVWGVSEWDKNAAPDWKPPFGFAVLLRGGERNAVPGAIYDPKADSFTRPEIITPPIIIDKTDELIFMLIDKGILSEKDFPDATARIATMVETEKAAAVEAALKDLPAPTPSLWDRVTSLFGR